MLVGQVRAIGFPTTPGRITRSELRIHHGEGTSYEADLEYAYEVAGVGYVANRYSYGMTNNSSRRHAEKIVAAHPVDSRVDVSYNPADPNDALLRPGLEAMDFFLPLFLVPFNVVMVGMFSYTLGAPIRGWLGLAPLAVAVRQRDAIWSVKVYGFLPISAAGVAALAVSFVSVFVVGFGQMFLPGWVLVIPAWCCVLVASAVAYARMKPSATAEVDDYQQRITLNLEGDSESLVVAISKVKSIKVQQQEVVLKIGSRNIKIPCRAERDAEWLGDWFRARLSIV
jgi:hypothetical protein